MARFTTNGLLNDLWNSKDGGMSWQQIRLLEPFAGRRGLSMIAAPGTSGHLGIVVTGGWTADGAKSDTYVTRLGKWEKLCHHADWHNRSHHTSAIVLHLSKDPNASFKGNKWMLLIVGGRSTDGASLNDSWISEDVGQSWVKVSG